jgi:hypothetical protein
MSTEDLRRAFARKIGLPFLLDVSQLQRSIQNGVQMRTWLYYDAREEYAYDHESPPAFWQIADHTRLYTPAEAARLKLHIKGKWQPPGPGSDGGRATEEEEPPEEVLIDILGGGRPSRVHGAGVPAQAFQQVLDWCQEHGASAVRRLRIGFQGIEKGRANDLAAIGLAIPQMGKAQFGIRLKLDVQWGPSAEECLELSFQGGWDRYRQMRTVCEDFARDPGSQINVRFDLVIDFEDEVALEGSMGGRGQQLGDIRDVLSQMEMGPIEVEAEVVYTQT